VNAARPPAVVIPTFNGARLLGEVLKSLQAQTLCHEVVVVDNASTDGTQELLAQEFGDARVVALNENNGFARAVNRGVAATGADTLVFLNNDVVCEPTFLEELCGVLDPAAGIVMAAGILLDWGSPARIDSAGIVFDRTLLAVDYLRGASVDVLPNGVADPPGPTAGAAAVNREAFDAVHGFDEHFFAYLEDVDLAARLIARGGRCRLAPNARALHRGSATLGAGSRRKNELMAWSRGYTIAKYRLHHRPLTLVKVVTSELAIAAGQVLVDRTVVSGTARISGFRAGLRVDREHLAALPERAARVSTARIWLDRARGVSDRRRPRRDAGDPARLSPLSGLGDVSLSGVRWIAAARFVAEVARLASVVVLAHVIAPSEFGLAAVALIVVMLAVAITTSGATTPLVQRPMIARSHIEVAALLALVTAAALTAVTLLIVAFVLPALLGGRAAHLTLLASPAFLIAAPAATPLALLTRRLDFRRLALVEAGATIVGTVVTVVLAFEGLEAEAIVVGGLATVTTSTALLCAAGPLAVPRWHRDAASEVLALGAPTLLGSILEAAFRNVDYAIVAARLSAFQAGLYWRGYQLAVTYQEKVSAVVVRVAFPVSARASDLDEMRRLRLRMGAVQTTVLFPVLFGLVATAPQLVPLVFGEEWAAAVVPTQILAAGGIALVAATGTAPLLLAAGKPRLLLWFNAAVLVLYTGLVLAVSPYGLTAVCVAVSSFTVAAACVQLALERRVGTQLRELRKAFAPAAVAGAAELLVAYFVARTLAHAGVSGAPIVLATVTAATCTYAAALRLAFPRAWSDVAYLAARLTPASRTAPRPSPPVGIPEPRAAK
jgi:O-antigen/teichoic acid export membrane protein/GT2 family glycosyltransferase